MKKIVTVLFVTCFLAVQIKAADIPINIVIPDEKIQKAKDGLLELWPVPLDDEGNPQFTQVQWFEVLVKNWVRASIHRGLVAKAKREAGQAIALDTEVVE